MEDERHHAGQEAAADLARNIGRLVDACREARADSRLFRRWFDALAEPLSDAVSDMETMLALGADFETACKPVMLVMWQVAQGLLLSPED